MKNLNFFLIICENIGTISENVDKVLKKLVKSLEEIYVDFEKILKNCSGNSRLRDNLLTVICISSTNK